MSSLVIGLPFAISMTGIYYIGILGKINREKTEAEFE